MLRNMNKRINKRISVVLQDNRISEANSSTNVGVIIDNKVKWHEIPAKFEF